MLYSNKNINDLLDTQAKTGAAKKMTKAFNPSILVSSVIPSEPLISINPPEEDLTPKQSISTHKELRIKKYDFETRVKEEGDDERNGTIKNLMDQHQSINSLIKSHYQKELLTQEDEFNRKMNERRDRSLERSLIKGGSKRDASRLGDSGAKANTGLNEAIGDAGLKKSERLLVPIANSRKG
jgi:hypothetical protein